MAGTTDPPVSNGLQMPPQAMLDLARRAAEVLVERSGSLAGENAWDGEFRAELSERLMEDPPERGRPAAEVMDRAVDEVLPWALSNDHPRSFGFVSSCPTWPGVVADFLAAGYNINSCNWLVSSGTSQLECVVSDWFRGWLGYPETAGGLLTSGGSAASLDALVAAREAAGYPDHAAVYMSDQSHSAHQRAVKIVGIRPDHARLVPSDDRFRIDLEALARMVAADRAAGLVPIAVCANAGATATGAVDPLDALADFCAAEGLWLHVDAAYGGFAILTERGKRLLGGIERADSVGLDAHKWFFQPYEVGCLQMSRSARALKIWMSVQTFGMAAFRTAIANGLDLAARAEEYIDASPLLECLSPASLSVVCFRINPADPAVDEDSLDEINREVLARLFWEDPAFVSSAVVSGKFSLRLCIVNHNTGWAT